MTSDWPEDCGRDNQGFVLPFWASVKKGSKWSASGARPKRNARLRFSISDEWRNGVVSKLLRKRKRAQILTFNIFREKLKRYYPETPKNKLVLKRFDTLVGPSVLFDKLKYSGVAEGDGVNCQHLPVQRLLLQLALVGDDSKRGKANYGRKVDGVVEALQGLAGNVFRN